MHLTAVLLGIACGRRTPQHDDSLTSATGGLPPLPTPMQGAPDTGRIVTPRGTLMVRPDSAPGAVAIPAEPLQWTQELVLTRLRTAGLAPGTPGDVRQPFFDPAGMRLELAGGRAEVQTFIFGDPGAVNRAMADLDTVRVAPRGAPVVWPMSPSLVLSNNLAAIVLTNDPSLRTRVRAALRAHP